MSNQILRVMWFVPPAVAVAASWQNQSGFVLEASQTQSSDEQFAALVSDSIDAVVTSMDNVLHWNSRPGPKDFVIVAQVEATTPLSLIGVKDTNNLQDLKGARILVDAPENGFIVALETMFDSAGLKLGDYSLDSVGGVRERFLALLEGRGDATLLGPPFDSLAVEEGLYKVASVQSAYPEFPGQGLVVRKQSVGGNIALEKWVGQLDAALDQLPGCIGKLRRALAELGTPEKAIAAMVASLPKTLTPHAGGVNLLVEHRKQLELTGSEASYEQIVDLALLK